MSYIFVVHSMCNCIENFAVQPKHIDAVLAVLVVLAVA